MIALRYKLENIMGANILILGARGFVHVQVKKLRTHKRPHLPEGDHARSLGLHVLHALPGDHLAALVQHNEQGDPLDFEVISHCFTLNIRHHVSCLLHNLS